MLYGRNLPGGEHVGGLTMGGVPLERLPVIIPLPADEGSRPAVSGFSPVRRAWDDGIEFRLPTPGGPANPIGVSLAKVAYGCRGAGAER